MSKTRVVIASKFTMAHALAQAMAISESHTLLEPESHTTISRGKGKKRKQWEKQK